MKCGDMVEWTSQSGSYRKTKRGEIVAILPAGQEIDTTWLNSLGLRTNSSCGYGMSRKHESYIVKIGNQAYWPRVVHLKVIKNTEDLFI